MRHRVEEKRETYPTKLVEAVGSSVAKFFLSIELRPSQAMVSGA